MTDSKRGIDELKEELLHCDISEIPDFVDLIIGAAIARDREECINEIEAMRDCYNTKKIDDAIIRIRQGGES